MKKVGTFVLCAVAFTAVVCWKVTPVHAYPDFFKEFEKKYTKEAPATPEETQFKETITTTKCGICHQGKTKKVRNTYGKAVEGFIPEVVGKPTLTKEDKDALKKDTVKINALLDKAAEVHSDAANPQSPTFGDLIKAGKLPGKDVEVSGDEKK
ncbi:MAG TPA: hypothetical protein VHY91_22295 [Pirellulales bacterium]|jgi:hypothetical protein|nr:hypothetical protein [Pirellulales bacterium]